MSTPFDNSENGGIPKRPDIPRPSSRFFQSFPLPIFHENNLPHLHNQHLDQHLQHNSFQMRENHINEQANPVPFLPLPTASHLLSIQNPHSFQPFQVPQPLNLYPKPSISATPQAPILPGPSFDAEPVIKNEQGIDSKSPISFGLENPVTAASPLPLLPQYKAPHTKYNLNGDSSPFIYPQGDAAFRKLGSSVGRNVSKEFETVISFGPEDFGKSTDPYKFAEKHFQPDLCALKIQTDEEWRRLNSRTIPESFWFRARYQTFGTSSKRFKSHAKTGNKEPMGKSIKDLELLVEMRGGLQRVERLGLWPQIQKQMGLQSAESFNALKELFLKTGNHSDTSSLNENNKRPSVVEVVADFTKKRNLGALLKGNPEMILIPVITSSNYEVRRLRRHRVLKGFHSTFDLATVKKAGISDQALTPFEEWILKRPLVDSSVFDHSDFFTLNEFQAIDEDLLRYFGIDSLVTLEDVEKIYWNEVKTQDHLPVQTLLRLLNTQQLFANKPDDPWNFHNLSLHNSSLLKFASNEAEVVRPPALSVGMFCSTENWTLEDHMMPLLDYNHLGLAKVWYFVSPKDRLKFELLVLQLSQESSHSCVVSQREQHMDPLFDKIIRQAHGSVQFNNDFLFAPAFLLQKGIKVEKLVQRPGEIVLKYPGSYSYWFSTGLSVSESVNFAPPLWLNYCVEGENLLKQQGLLARFSTWDLLINLAKNCKYPALVSKARGIYDALLDSELSMRDKVRSLVSDLTEKVNKNFEMFLCDSDLSISFPSVVYLIRKDSSTQFSMTLEDFLLFHKKEAANFDKEIDYVELVTYYEDEKLRQFSKTLNRDITTSSDWSEKVADLLLKESKPSFKLLRQLVNEGEKIFTPEYLTTVYDEKSEGDFYNRFVQLSERVEEYQNWIDMAQKYLSSKHQSRKRKGRKDEEDHSNNNDNKQELSFQNLCQLICDIPNSSFYTEEMDQLINLSMEIEDYETSARKLLSNSNDLVLEELHNILSLGSSFGLDLPSVLYLKEYEKKETWLATFKQLRSASFVQTFKDLLSLESFLQEGRTIETISKKHSDNLMILQDLCANTKAINDLGRSIITKNSKTTDITDLSKVLQDSYEYPVDPEIRVELTKMQAEYEEVAQKASKFIESIEKVHSLKSSKELYEKSLEKLPKFIQIKQLLEKAHSLKIVVPDSVRLENEYFKNAEQWLKSVRQILHRPTVSLSTLKTNLNHIANGVKATLGNPQDLVLVGSEEEPSSNENIYCHCRLGESGLMVECERCNEWYHLGCFNLSKNKMKNLSFICPICDEKDEHKFLYENLKVVYKPDSVALIQLYQQSQLLKYFPVDEYLDVESIFENLDTFNKAIASNLIWSGEKLVEPSIHKVRFYLRKLCGCPVELNSLQTTLKQRLDELVLEERSLASKLALELQLELELQLKIEEETPLDNPEDNTGATDVAEVEKDTNEALIQQLVVDDQHADTEAPHEPVSRESTIQHTDANANGELKESQKPDESSAQHAENFLTSSATMSQESDVNVPQVIQSAITEGSDSAFSQASTVTLQEEDIKDEKMPELNTSDVIINGDEVQKSLPYDSLVQENQPSEVILMPTKADLIPEEHVALDEPESVQKVGTAETLGDPNFSAKVQKTDKVEEPTETLLVASNEGSLPVIKPKPANSQVSELPSEESVISANGINNSKEGPKLVIPTPSGDIVPSQVLSQDSSSNNAKETSSTNPGLFSKEARDLTARSLDEEPTNSTLPENSSTNKDMIVDEATNVAERDLPEIIGTELARDINPIENSTSI